MSLAPPQPASLIEAHSVAAPIIMVATAIGAPLCLYAAYIVGISGVSGSRDPLAGALMALGAVSFPIVSFVLLRGGPTMVRSIAAVILGALPLSFIITAMINIF